jgi:hypothetical protein
LNQNAFILDFLIILPLPSVKPMSGECSVGSVQGAGPDDICHRNFDSGLDSIGSLIALVDVIQSADFIFHPR